MEMFSIVAFLIAFGALALGSEIIRRLNVQHDTIRTLTERLLMLEIKLAEQENSYSENAKILQSLESLAKSVVPAPNAAAAAPPTKKAAGTG